MHRFLVSAALALALFVPAAAQAADPPPGSTWSEMYIDDGYGPKLHADVLRPKGIPADKPTPVIMTVSPYVGHGGQTPPTDYDPTAAGPSSRWYDFVNGAHLFDRGYTYVMVDLPGFGGSGGCNDWGGPSEQSGVKRAVQWAAAQPWSNGRVGMYGKSYDGWTGLMALAQRPRGLAAVVSQEPVYSGYRYLYTNGVRFLTSLADPAIFNASDLNPGTLNDTPDYLVNGETAEADSPGCHGLNFALQQQGDSEDIPFWASRNLLTKVHGETTPLFLTQGFLEDNTKPDGAYQLFNEMAGPKRAWFGMWDHVRGNDAVGKNLAMGRAGWFDEVMRFYDRYVKGLPSKDAPTEKDPQIAVETSDGTWREETSWPPADSTMYTSALKAGSYADDGNNNGTGSGAGTGVWTFSKPLTTTAHLAGEPRLHLDVTGPTGRENLAADVYDVDAAGKAILISRTASLVGSTGKLDLRMYGDDWILPAGHRIGVLLSSSNAEWWSHVPTQQTVTVTGGTISLPFLRYERTKTIQGDPSIKLKSYKASAPFTVDQATIAAGTQPGFVTPPPLTKRKAR
jgi:predicted acyl esterase